MGPWSIYQKCLWILLTHVYWFRVTGGIHLRLRVTKQSSYICILKKLGRRGTLDPSGQLVYIIYICIFKLIYVWFIQPSLITHVYEHICNIWHLNERNQLMDIADQSQLFQWQNFIDRKQELLFFECLQCFSWSMFYSVLFQMWFILFSSAGAGRGKTFIWKVTSQTITEWGKTCKK